MHIFFKIRIRYTDMQVCMGLYMCAFAYDVKQMLLYKSYFTMCSTLQYIQFSFLLHYVIENNNCTHPICFTFNELGMHCRMKCIDLCGSLRSFSMQCSMSSPLQLSSHRHLIVRPAFALGTV